MGLPCEHKLQAMIANTTSLAVSDFDRHWWLQQPLHQASAPVIYVLKNTIELIVRRYAEMDPHQQKQLQTALVGLNATEYFKVDEPNEVRTRGRPPFSLAAINGPGPVPF